jgi:hypothetical protein
MAYALRMVREFVSAALPWMIVVHALSVGLLVVALLLFSQTRSRRKALIQTLAITADDDDAVMHQWVQTDRRQRHLRAWYACSIIGIALASTVVFASLPYWL